jgi:threonyl-tRNA synthetase
MSPRQTIIIPVAEKFHDYAKEINAKLLDSWMRSETDLSDNSFSKKIRNAETMKINYILIVWEQEEKDNTVSIRNSKTKEQFTLKIDEFFAKISKEIEDKSL